MSTFAQFYTLLKQLPYADKDELVNVYSNGATTSLRELHRSNTPAFNRMVADMETKVRELAQTNSRKVSAIGESDTQKRHYRSLILRALQDQGIAVKNRDWSAVNDFVSRHAGESKSLSNMTLDELKKFNKQVHKILDWHKKKVENQLLNAIQN